MSLTTDSNPIDAPAGRWNILDESEEAGLLRLTTLVEHLFHVPIAYMALLGPDLTVITRIGSGSGHWDSLKTYPLAAALANPIVWPDPSGMQTEGFICGDVRFAERLRSSRAMDWNLAYR